MVVRLAADAGRIIGDVCSGDRGKEGRDILGFDIRVWPDRAESIVSPRCDMSSSPM